MIGDEHGDEHGDRTEKEEAAQQHTGVLKDSQPSWNLYIYKTRLSAHVLFI